ncbi:TIGR03617 family F420-dependent LLM class oxidoreductase [Actinomycetospora endophytica]|uniref:TIGR03617 family F420-dependent LLM class oxidoreductase n=1 Tax=Actinomycetospora endophytica TaxID=2291215 RepID=A0ABS8P6U2_9PSEU|nr:TIGR03617 family F420-dependent LLM class oxidoreductase [Actinomycetospora endophytica]MCD2192774.1 TIGR03617 family F420-dependent LLM class oxidoreductase [Actinomycetospora endophytica]
MKVDATLVTGSPDDFVDAAVSAEKSGYDAVWVAETQHDPTVGLTLASTRTERITLGTAITVAFARTPMTTAITANDLHAVSGGRYVLGLGTQIRPHVTKRFSMPWSRPADRMREYIQAVRAIWATWNDGEPLRFVGEFYTHTLMTPFFSPPPNPYGTPPIHLAGVGPRMTEVAGEVADGFLAHAFTTERYLHEVTLPALWRGFETAGRGGSGFEFSGTALIATGSTEEEFAASVRDVRRQVAFYGSTPAYAGVLELHGWGELATELNRLSKHGDWDAMGDLVDDEVLHAIAVVAEPDDVGPALARRFGGIAARIPFYAPTGADLDRWEPARRYLQDMTGEH